MVVNKRKNKVIKLRLLKFISFTIFIISVGQIVFNVINTLKARDLIDFSVYYIAVESFIQGKNPYNYLYNNIPFNYPPSSLIFLAPLKLLPIKLTEMMLTLLSFIMLWCTFWLISKITKIKISWPYFLIILAFFNQTFPVKFTLILGQVNLIVLGLSLAGLYYYIRSGDKKQNRLISIISLSIASSLKLFPLYLLPLFLIRGDLSFILIVFGLFLVFNLIAAPHLFIKYFFQILPGLSSVSQTPNFYDQSLLALLIRMNVAPTQAKVVAATILIIVYGLVLWQSRRRPLWESFALILCLFSIGNFFSWQHHLVFSYPLIFILFLKSISNKKRLWLKFLPFFALWAIFVFHFPSGNFAILKNPIIASYQTITIMIIIIYSLWKKIL